MISVRSSIETIKCAISASLTPKFHTMWI